MVFRRFGITTSNCDGVAELLRPRRIPYVHRNSPRAKVGRNLYTSTEYLAQYEIAMHNEVSYARR